jgi:hypothetical protein
VRANRKGEQLYSYLQITRHDYLFYIDQSVNRNRTGWDVPNYVNNPNRFLEFLTDSLLIEL